MTHRISEFQLMPETTGTYFGVNCYSHVAITREIGCWTLMIEDSDGKRNFSTHNTFDEAQREAECRTSWEVDLNFNPSGKKPIDNG